MCLGILLSDVINYIIWVYQYVYNIYLLLIKMVKKAGQLKVGDKIVIGGETLNVESTETSDIGKQGTKKVRISALKGNGERVVIIRPEDYPIG